MTITIDNLHQHTGEQVYNHIVAHLLSMKVRSYDDNRGCAYRSPSGNMCAAGCLIPNADYSLNMEQASWTELADRGWVPVQHARLIRRLQMVHDDASNWGAGLNMRGKEELQKVKELFMYRNDWNNLPE